LTDFKLKSLSTENL